MPRSAKRVTVTIEQCRRLLKRRNPPFDLWSNHGSQVVVVAHREVDDSYWIEWRGTAVFWASRWFEIPRAAGRRIFEFDEATQATLADLGC